MARADFEQALARDRAAVDARLGAIVDARASHHETIGAALRYALLGGGKRLRPLLCLWTHDVFSRDPATRAAALDAACALECVHTYSLAHDDLPCMDDDDLRRGRASLHRRFDEATAVLAGDALLALGFEVASSLDAPPALALDAVRVLAQAAGSAGLITGQALDLAAATPAGTPAGEESAARLARVEQIHEFKTARLIAAAMELGAIVSRRCDGEARQRVRRAGLLVGRAFQIVDDLLDLEGDAATLGKTPRKDVAQGKLTYPAAAGVPAAQAAVRESVARGLALVPEASGTPLADLVALVAARRS